ncbi:hypothetical protein [Endozoicomonas elysicola]|uniref:Uncharacterized protein n=1 Tax=Endozoicomonas elysicola TaxID=305900 RepID=A0A081KE48_9GAMM|nr:hypothetical protein [Endozoicomonas elysicola]KEI72424.1 hypothetical protein GV64_18350 [Endozoicomonas elysicola]
MSGSLNGVENNQADGVSTTQEMQGSAAPASIKSVSSGFDSNNSISFSSNGKSAIGSDDSVALDSPDSAQLSSSDYLQRSFQARVEGFRSILADFNLQLDSGAIDLSDTQTLLMVFRGMLNDIKVLNSAQSIDLISAQRRDLQNKRIKIADIKLNIKQRQNEIGGLEQTLKVKNKDIQEKGTRLTAKSAALASAESATPVDQALVRKLSNEIAQIQRDINGLQSEVGSLNLEIADLRHLNSVDHLRTQFLDVFIHFFAAQEQGVFAIKKLLFSSLSQESRASLDSGERALDDLEFELLRLEKIFESEASLLVIAKALSREQAGDLTKKTRKDVQPDELAATLEGILAPSLLREVYSLVSSADLSPEAITPSIDKGVVDTTRALSVILLAEPPVGEDDEPESQPYLGDNLALEGADNPETFALLLLKDRMGDIADLHPVIDGDDARIHYLARLFDVEGVVDDMVIKALKDSERSEAAIRRASKA